MRGPKPLPRAMLFWSKVEKTETCWIWTGRRSAGGYGNIQFKSTDKHHYAHRWAYENVIGPIPEGLQLDHLCRNRLCVNPSHLEPVTQQENLRRGTSPVGINAQKTHCKRGHPFDDINTYRRLNGQRVCRICNNSYPKWKVKRESSSD